MPRSFRFDHFRAPPSTPPKPQGPHPVSRPDLPASATGLHYGHKFQETEELHHKLEQRSQGAPRLSIPSLEPGGAPEEQRPTAGPEASSRSGQGEAGPSSPGWARLVQVVWAQAQKPWTLIQHAASDLSQAGALLLRIPADAARQLRRS